MPDPAFTDPAFTSRLAVTGEAVEEMCRVPPVGEVFEPAPALIEAYRETSDRFRRLCRAVKPEFTAR